MLTGLLGLLGTLAQAHAARTEAEAARMEYLLDYIASTLFRPVLPEEGDPPRLLSIQFDHDLYHRALRVTAEFDGVPPRAMLIERVVLDNLEINLSRPDRNALFESGHYALERRYHRMIDDWLEEREVRAAQRRMRERMAAADPPQADHVMRQYDEERHLIRGRHRQRRNPMHYVTTPRARQDWIEGLWDGEPRPTQFNYVVGSGGGGGGGGNAGPVANNSTWGTGGGGGAGGGGGGQAGWPEANHRVWLDEAAQVHAMTRVMLDRAVDPPMIAGPEMTATEVLARQREAARRTAPVRGMIENFFHNIWPPRMPPLAPALTREGLERAMQQVFVHNGYGAEYIDGEEKAKALLVEHLTPEQRVQFESRQSFTVIGSNGGHYLITWGTTMNVHGIKRTGGHEATFEHLCFRPTGDVATGDIVLAQKIMLECDEAAARRVANIAPTPRRPMPF